VQLSAARGKRPNACWRHHSVVLWTCLSLGSLQQWHLCCSHGPLLSFDRVVQVLQLACQGPRGWIRGIMSTCARCIQCIVSVCALTGICCDQLCHAATCARRATCKLQSFSQHHATASCSFCKSCTSCCQSRTPAAAGESLPSTPSVSSLQAWRLSEAGNGSP
jgi:hypothetical protein